MKKNIHKNTIVTDLIKNKQKPNRRNSEMNITITAQIPGWLNSHDIEGHAKKIGAN